MPSSRPRTPAANSARHHPDVGSAVDDFRRILRELRLAAQSTQRTSGLSAAQIFMLSALGDGDGASISELAERTMTDRSSAAAVVVRLIDAGLVVRSTPVTDRRRAAIKLTPRGRAVLRKAPRAPGALLLEGVESLPRATQASLARALRSLTTAMGINRTAAGMLFEDPVPRKAARRT